MTVRDVIEAAWPVLIAAALVFGPAAAMLASRRLRNPALWLLLGALTGPLAIVLLFAAPSGRCRVCAEQTRGFGSVCTTCGARLKGPSRTAGIDGDGDPPAIVAADWAAVSATTRARRSSASPDTIAARPERLAAIGAKRPASDGSPANRYGASRAAAVSSAHGDLVVLAIGVFVRGSEPLLTGSRYLIARTAERLLIIGPVEPSPEHVELDLPLDEIEASYIPDRLVVTGWTDRRSRRWVLAFQSLAGLTASAIDEALTASPDRLAEAVGR